MKIQVTFELDDAEGDPTHETGLSERQYVALFQGKHLPFGAYDIEVERIDS